MLQNGDLVPAVASELRRADFEKYVQQKLIQAYRDGLAKPDTPLLQTMPMPRILSLFPSE